MIELYVSVNPFCIFTAVPNDLSLNTEILTVSAVDTLDYGINADVSFSVVGGNGSSLFAVRYVTSSSTMMIDLVSG